MQVIKDAKSVYAKGKMWIEEWGSLAEALDYAGDNPEPRSSDRNGGGWAGETKSLRDAVKLGHQGYAEIRPDVERMFTEMESQLADRLEVAFQTQFAVTGAVVDVGRYLGGEPECMIDFIPEPSSRMGRVVKVLVNGSASSMIDPKDIIKRGVVVCALVDSIHKLGMGVEVYVEFPTNTSGVNDPKGHVHTALVKLHDSQQLLDINNLMFALCHPSMLRRINFSVLEKTECDYARDTTYGGGYGYPAALECAERIGADVRVEMLQSGNRDIIHKPVDWVMSTLSGLGVL
ncbi:MAG: hypothetical protein EBT27_11805 [Betaproteobacteria bacterium]|nr:hypothetical protein [Betaproteobacteria bacterium]